MKVTELAGEYKAAGQRCRERAAELRGNLNAKEMSESERIELRRRISVLDCMGRDAMATGKYLAHYYEGGTNHGQLCQKDRTEGISELAALFADAGAVGKPHGPAYQRGHRQRTDGAAGGDGAHVLSRTAHHERDRRGAVG